MRYLFLLFIFPNLLFAQIINIENKRLAKSNGIHGAIDIDFDYNKSTKVDWDFSTNSYFQWDKNKYSLLLLNNVNFDRADGVDFANNSYQHMRFSYDINNILTIETYLQNQSDPVRSIENRRLAGAGIKSRLYYDTYFGISAFYEKETLTNGLESTGYRLSNYWQLKFTINPFVKCLVSTYIQPRITQFSDVRISNETVFSIKLSDRFFFTNKLILAYDTYPASNIPSLIYNLGNGIKYEF
mgnify:CR=1 FL=1